MELIIRNITPATVDMNINEIEGFISSTKEKYQNLVFTDDQIDEAKSSRATLNKLEKNIAEVRKKIEKESKMDIEKLINTLKQAEKDVKELSNNIGFQIKAFEEKEWETKQEEISEIIDNVFRENPELKLYIIKNSKWKNKGITLNKIEDEIEAELSRLNLKKDFIIEEIKKANEEISFKIIFENMINLLNAEFPEIVNQIRNEKDKRKETEENLRKQAEEKARQEAELEAQEQQAKAVIVEEVPLPNFRNEKDKRKETEEKYFDTTIRFEKAPLSFLKALKELTDYYKLKFELKENIAL